MGQYRQIPRQFRALARVAWDQGWTVKQAKRSGHLKWRSPDRKRLVVSAGTPSDQRAEHNLRTQLRKAGLQL